MLMYGTAGFAARKATSRFGRRREAARLRRASAIWIEPKQCHTLARADLIGPLARMELVRP